MIFNGTRPGTKFSRILQAIFSGERFREIECLKTIGTGESLPPTFRKTFQATIFTD
jgi:hypothetical protein